MDTRAFLSPCRRYRYALWRRWSDGPQVLFIMLNPSTADEVVNDPTIRRCINFAKSWGFGGIAVANLFAFRTSSPAQLKISEDPIGPGNDRWLRKLVKESEVVVAAWGNHGDYLNRSEEVRKKLPRLHCLGLTQSGEPKHPLYINSLTPYQLMQQS